MNNSRILLSLAALSLGLAAIPSSAHALDVDLQLGGNALGAPSPEISVGFATSDRVTLSLGVRAQYGRSEMQGNRSQAYGISLPLRIEVYLSDPRSVGFVPSLQLYGGYSLQRYETEFVDADGLLRTHRDRQSGAIAGALMGGRYFFSDALAIGFGVGVGGTWQRSHLASFPGGSSLSVSLDYRASLLFRI